MAGTQQPIQVSLAKAEFSEVGKYDPPPGKEVEFGGAVTSLLQARKSVLLASLSLVPQTVPGMIRCSLIGWVEVWILRLDGSLT